MPIVAAGDQGYRIDEMLPPILDAAIHWLELGLAIDRVAILAHSAAQAEEAHGLFRAAADGYQAPVIEPVDEYDYDVFISYSHKDAKPPHAFMKRWWRLPPRRACSSIVRNSTSAPRGS